MVNSFLRRSKFMPRNPLKSLCGGSCGGVLRRFAAVAHKSLKNLMRWFCGGVRRGSPIPPIRWASLKRGRLRNEGECFTTDPPSCEGRGRVARNHHQPAETVLPAVKIKEQAAYSGMALFNILLKMLELSNIFARLYSLGQRLGNKRMFTAS